MEKDQKKSLIEFPCYFDIKVMGEANANFSKDIICIIKEHDSNFNSSKIEMKGSSNGKYISLTCSVHVKNQRQLDKIYIKKTKNPITKFVL